MNKKINNMIYSLLPSLLAVLVALIIGAMIIIARGVNPLVAYGSMIKAAFYQTSRVFKFNGLHHYYSHLWQFYFHSKVECLISVFKGK